MPALGTLIPFVRENWEKGLTPGKLAADVQKHPDAFHWIS